MPDEQHSGFKPEETPLTPDEVCEMAAAFCDRAPTPDELDRLQRAILTSAEARRSYLSVRKTHAALLTQAAQGGRTQGAPMSLADGVEPPNRLPLSRLLSRIKLGYLTIAATMLLAAIPAAWMNWVSQSPAGRLDARGPRLDVSDSAEVVAHLTKASEGCRLLIDGSSVDSDSVVELHANAEVCLITGAIHVRFESGVQTAFLAPAVFKPLTPLSIEMSEGHLTADAGDDASGFTVETIDAEVVDLGTVFGVSVSSADGTEVVVFDGEVEVKSPKSTESLAAPFASQTVETGEGVEVGNRASPTPLISFACADYVLPQELFAQPVSRMGRVIASVSDNLKRGEQATFGYEIISGGMREDAIAFADRGYHQWNGISEVGMPDYLKGADYVLGFSNLKYDRDYEMYITLGQPANLYVFWDERIAVPGWLKGGFVCTEDKIGLDEGPHVDERHRVLQRKFPGLGPGRSIDQVFTVWKRVVTEPSTVTCGYNSKRRAAFQMYGVAATPLNGLGDLDGI